MALEYYFSFTPKATIWIYKISAQTQKTYYKFEGSAYTHNEILLFSYKKEGNSITCCNRDES